MFNMLSGAAATRPESAGPRPAVAAVPDARDEDDGGFADGIDDTPFVEIGGPTGPVFSAGAAAMSEKNRGSSIFTNSHAVRA